MSREENAWKAAVFTSIGTMLLVGVGVAVANIALDAEEAQERARRVLVPSVNAPRATAPAPRVFASASAPAEVVEECNRYAAQARRDTRFGSNANRKSDQAMAAYQQCMARRGYRGELQ